MNIIVSLKKTSLCIFAILALGLLFLLPASRIEAETTEKYAAMLSSSNNQAFDVRRRAGFYPGAYRIMEGGCSDGTYGYYAMLNASLSKTKIVKVNLSKVKYSPGQAVVKVSAPLSLGHANDMCYNPETGKLVVIHNVDGSTLSKNISIVRASDLALESTHALDIPSALDGATASQLSSIKGLCGIAYNVTTKEFVIMVSGATGNFLVLDSSLTPVRYIKCEKRSLYTNQGIDCTSDSIYVARSSGSNPNCTNILEEYSWDGTYKNKISIKGMTYEIENVYHVEDTFSVSCYAKNTLLSPNIYGFIYDLTSTSSVTGLNVKNRSMILRSGSKSCLNASVIPQNTSNRSIIYMSNNNQAVTVDGAGNCTARNPGIATIIIYTAQGYYATTARVTVVATPKITKLSNESAGVRINWPTQVASTNIAIWRKAGKKSSARFKKLAVINGRYGTYVDKKAKPGKYYSYRLIATNGKVTTAWSSRKSIWRLKTPKITKAKSTGPKTMTVRWKKVKGASLYKVVYSTSPKFKKKKSVKIKGQSSTQVNIRKGLHSGKTYYVKVYACHKGGKKIWSHESKIKKVKMKEDPKNK